MFKMTQSFTKLSVLSAAFFPMVVSAAVVTTTTTTQNFVTMPNLNPGFEFNIAALWLKPGASNLNYVINNKELPAESPTWREQEISPSFSPGFQLGVGYIFPNNMAQDVQLNWTHLNTSDSASINADGVSYFLGPDYEIGPLGIPITHASGTAKFNYDVVNLDVGQYVNFGPHLMMRFFGGLSAGYLKEEVISTYSGTTGAPFAGPFSTRQDVTSKFTGIGPRVGAGADYSTNSGFGILGEAAVSGLIGSLDANTNYTSSAAELLALFGETVNHQFINDQSVNQVVPGIEGKVGVYYKGMFNHQATVNVTLGYQAAVYINAISQYLPSTLVAGEGIEVGGIFVATMMHTLSNYSVQGPFLDFSVAI